MLVETLALRRGEARDVLPADALATLARLDRRLAEAETAIARAPRDPSVRLPLEQRRTEVTDEAWRCGGLCARATRSTPRSPSRESCRWPKAPAICLRAVFVSYLRDVIACSPSRSIDGAGCKVAISASFPVSTIPSSPTGRCSRRRAADASSRLASFRRPLPRRARWRAGRGSSNRCGDDRRGAGASRLIEPLPELLRSQRWIISPDSALALVPFETLPHRGRPLVLDARDQLCTVADRLCADRAARTRIRPHCGPRAAVRHGRGAVPGRHEFDGAAGKPANVQLASLAGALAADPRGRATRIRRDGCELAAAAEVRGGAPAGRGALPECRGGDGQKLWRCDRGAADGGRSPRNTRPPSLRAVVRARIPLDGSAKSFRRRAWPARHHARS